MPQFCPPRFGICPIDVWCDVATRVAGTPPSHWTELSQFGHPALMLRHCLVLFRLHVANSNATCDLFRYFHLLRDVITVSTVNILIWVSQLAEVLRRETSSAAALGCHISKRPTVRIAPDRLSVPRVRAPICCISLILRPSLMGSNWFTVMWCFRRISPN